jgi:S1-C subfamily serine protease
VPGPSLTLRLTLAAAAAALVAGFAVAIAEAQGGSVSRTPTTGVVVVTTNLAYQGGAAAGTGIVLTSSGEVLTNNHVIKGATTIRVSDLSTGRTYTATVAGYSVSRDIALLKVNASGLKTAAIGSSAGIKTGDRVTAVGNAGGAGTLTVSTGALVRLHQSITVSDDQGGSSQLSDLIETNAELQPGDSGGPLLDRSGRVIGVDAAGSSGSRFQQSAGDGYAIPIDTATAIVHQVEAGHKSSSVHIGPTAFLGVEISGQDVSGAVIAGVVQGGPADQAGLTAGDTITSFGGQRVTSPTSLQLLIRQATPGTAYRITWIDQFGSAGSATVRPVSGPAQ